MKHGLFFKLLLVEKTLLKYLRAEAHNEALVPVVFYFFKRLVRTTLVYRNLFRSISLAFLSIAFTILVEITI